MARKKADLFDYSWYNSIKSLVENLINEWKKSGQISGGISRLSYDEAGVPLIEGIKVAVNDHAYEAVDAMDKAMTEINAKLKTGAATESEYYKYMELYRDNFLEKGSAAWWKYTEKIIGYEASLNEDLKKELETRKNAIVKSYSEILSEAGSEITEIERLESRLKSKLSDYASSFLDNSVTFKNAGQSYLKDGIWHSSKDLTYKVSETEGLKNAVTAINEYYSAISALKNKPGVLPEFITSLQNMAPGEAVSLANKLLYGSDEDFTAYMDGVRALNDAVTNVSSMLISDNVKAFLDEFGNVGNNFKKDLKAALNELPSDFFEGGELSGEAFSSGFLSKFNLVAEKINELSGKLTQAESYITNNASYNFYSSGESVSAQLEAARNANTIDRLRGTI